MYACKLCKSFSTISKEDFKEHLRRIHPNYVNEKHMRADPDFEESHVLEALAIAGFIGSSETDAAPEPDSPIETGGGDFGGGGD